jgi:hypothetical protein
MATTLDLVYQYRLLIGKCQSGQGLDVDEIDALMTIEALFDVQRAKPGTGRCRRAHTRDEVDLRATLRNKKLSDAVRVVDLGPGGMVCRNVPYLERGDQVEVVFDDDELRVSYRFHATVAWVDDDGDDWMCGLELVGTPVLVRFGPPSGKSKRAESENGETAKFERVAA